MPLRKAEDGLLAWRMHRASTGGAEAPPYPFLTVVEEVIDTWQPEP